MAQIAAAAFRPLGPSEAIGNDCVVPYYLDDRKLRLSVARVGGRLYALAGLCTCAVPACPLSGDLLTGTTLMCQCHGSRFDISTGAVLAGPATKPLDVYQVQEVDGAIEVRTVAEQTGADEIENATDARSRS